MHRLYYGPVEENGNLLKTSPELRAGSIVSEDVISRVQEMGHIYGQEFIDSELINSINGPVIRLTQIQFVQSQGHDTRQTKCNKTFFVKLSDISKALLPLLAEEPTFPLEPFKLKLVKEEVECQQNPASNGNSCSSTD